MGFLDIFRSRALRRPEREAPSDTVRRISAAIEELPEDRATYLAAFAFILGRVANADLDISEDEVLEMERIVERVGGVPEAQAVLIVQIAKGQHRLFGQTESFLVTREFNRIATREQKLALLQCLYAVSSSDDSISVMEDNEIRAVSRELLLDHADFIAVRSSYRNQLSVLKG